MKTVNFKTLAMVVSLFSLALILSGCPAMQNQNGQVNPFYSTGAGAILGQAIGNDTSSTLIGAGLGFIGGELMGAMNTPQQPQQLQQVGGVYPQQMQQARQVSPQALRQNATALKKLGRHAEARNQMNLANQLEAQAVLQKNGYPLQQTR